MSEQEVLVEGEKHVFKRKIIIIKRALQFKYMGLIFVSMLLIAFVATWDIYYSVGKILTEFEPAAIPIFMKINGLMVLKLLLLVVICLVISLFISHKFAGPVFHLEKLVTLISQGDLTCRAHFRRGDELTELGKVFNEMMDYLQNKVGRNKTLAAKIASRLEEIAAKINSKEIAADQIKNIAQDLETLRNEVLEIGSEFKV
ncbi:MAG: methyl-accepting chemotaxis protein [Elusimicrobiota bacterium]